MTQQYELPPLPEPGYGYYEAGQMQAYALAAIEADRKRSVKQLAAYKALVASLEAQCSHLRKMYEELKASTNPELLASERAANAMLTEELEAERKRRGDCECVRARKAAIEAELKL